MWVCLWEPTPLCKGHLIFCAGRCFSHSLSFLRAILISGNEVLPNVWMTGAALPAGGGSARAARRPLRGVPYLCVARPSLSLHGFPVLLRCFTHLSFQTNRPHCPKKCAQPFFVLLRGAQHNACLSIAATCSCWRDGRSPCWWATRLLGRRETSTAGRLFSFTNV